METCECVTRHAQLSTNDRSSFDHSEGAVWACEVICKGSILCVTITDPVCFLLTKHYLGGDNWTILTLHISLTIALWLSFMCSVSLPLGVPWSNFSWTSRTYIVKTHTHTHKYNGHTDTPVHGSIQHQKAQLEAIPKPKLFQWSWNTEGQIPSHSNSIIILHFFIDLTQWRNLDEKIVFQISEGWCSVADGLDVCVKILWKLFSVFSASRHCIQLKLSQMTFILSLQFCHFDDKNQRLTLLLKD